jgi:signal transduction histidine kinase
MRKLLRNFLVGNMSQEPLSDYRRALLTSFSILVSILTSGYYVVVNWFVNFNPSLHFYYIYITVALIAFALNRTGRHKMAKVIFLSCVNFVVFAFASREPEISAAFLFFIASSLMPLAIFDAKEKNYAFSFLALSVVLYSIARFTSFSLVPDRPIDAAYLARAYNNNFLIVYVLSVLTVYFLVLINFSVEASLKQREKQILEKNNVLIKTNEELDRFIYSTSHDLRAPINSIQGLINLSELATTPEDIRKYHELMRERLSKLEHVLNDIMQYSKNAKLEIEKKEINVWSEVQRALTDVRYMEGADRITVNIEVPEDLTIITDPMRFRIIINNLISNACKYSDRSKTNQFITIKTKKERTEIVFTIEDNGEGIDPQHQEKVFNMFHRATSRSIGSGLGLYLVKEAVERLGGSISLVSQYGKGSLFTVKLPLTG